MSKILTLICFCSFTSLSLPRFPSSQWPVCLQWFVMCCEDNALFRNLFQLRFQVSQQEQLILYIYIIYIYNIVYIYIVHIFPNPSTNHQHQKLRRFSLPLPSGELALTTEVCPLLPVPCNLRISLRRLGKDYNMASACDPQVVKWLGVSVDVFFLQLTTIWKR